MPADAPTLASKGSLLIVDDEPSMAKYMGLVLGREGFQVLTAFNAEEGWALFQRQAPQVRAVVTDWAMPGDWNGLELARRVREASPNTPVLLVSGYEPSGIVGRVQRAVAKALYGRPAAIRRPPGDALLEAMPDANARRPGRKTSPGTA
jgi:CheY-like chemotaxis protein